jgi:splicing factor 3A subunit 3
MQALGIPNTKVFFEITRIKDGIKLWRTLNQQKEKTLDRRSIQEYEDSEGNVYDRETFRLLTKQGIL